MRRFVFALLSFALVASSAAFAASPVPDSLSWRNIGPFRGGRAIAVAGVPNEPNHFYFGSVNGGVWETTNAGRTWKPIFDSQNIGSIGAIAVAPSNAKTIYVGTGEADMRSSIANGNGMYKSTDGGKTWQHIGLDDSAQIGEIIVDPRDANTAYVAVLGHSYGPNEMRGVFKTSDGGATWSKVLYKNADTGAIHLALDPAHPDTVYASLWQTRRPPWSVYPPSCGPGSGLYKSTDAGKTWTQLTNGIPAKVCKIGLSISTANPSRVYAEIDTPTQADGGIYRSDDAGATWTHVNGGKTQQRIWGRGWYFSGITADPKNADVLYVMNTATYRTEDGGKTFTALKGSPGGDDYHIMWINPNDSNILALAGDQGTVISLDRGNTWSSWLNQSTAQIYRVATDDAYLYNVYGAQQDSGSIEVASQSIHQNLTWSNWRLMDAGGESGSIQADPEKPGTVYGGGFVTTREWMQSGEEQNIDPATAYPHTTWRSTWTLPFEISPIDHAMYTTHQVIFRSRDHGNSWQIISPDLTRHEDGKPKNLDAQTLADNDGVTRHGVVYSLKPSPFDKNTLWAGTDDGKVWLTRDGGAHWSDITPKALTPWSKVAMIDASHFDRNTAYIAVDRHRLDDYTPYIYVTRNGGASWSLITQGLPTNAGASVNVVREDPKTRGLLFAGTERGIFISYNDGANWQSMQRNLPMTSVRDITIHNSDVVIATHGRGFWIMDDIAPLRQHAAMNGESHLFAPIVTYRLRRAGGVGGGIADEGTPIQPDEPQAPNPPLGMYIDYNVASSAPVTLEFVDSHGKVVRHYASADKVETIDPNTQDIAEQWIAQPVPVPTDTGMHRFVWDFTTRKDGGPLAPPGIYTVRATIGGKTYSQRAVLLRDPRSLGNDADLIAQYQLANAVLDKVDQIRAALKNASAMQKKKLSHLSEQFQGLEQAIESADAAPTHDQRAAYATLSTELRKLTH